MSNKRITILARILEEERLKKLAQEVQPETVVDTTSADAEADSIFNKLFDQTMEEMGLNKLLG